MSGFVERQFASDDVAINVTEWADNGPPLLFIHGITSDWSTWEKIVPAFVTDWHCFAVDLRGHGKSGHIPGAYHRDLYAADLVALIKYDIDEPTYVVGHSLGATTALGVAAAIPEMVRAVVYEDPPMFTHEVTGDGGTPRSRFGWQLELLDAGAGEEDLAEAVFKHNGGARSASMNGVELSRPLDEQTFATIRTALLDYGVIFINASEVIQKGSIREQMLLNVSDGCDNAIGFKVLR